MANKEEWKEFFELTEGRKPTIEEFTQAMKSGEIDSSNGQEQSRAEQSRAEQSRAEQSSITGGLMPKKKSRKKIWIFSGLGLVIAILLGIFLPPYIRVQTLGFTTLYNKEKAAQIIPAPVIDPTFTYPDSSGSSHIINSQTFKEEKNTNGNNIVSYYSDGSYLIENKYEFFNLVKGNAVLSLLGDNLSTMRGGYEDEAKEYVYFLGGRIPVSAADQVNKREGNQNWWLINDKYYGVYENNTCNVKDLNSGNEVKSLDKDWQLENQFPSGDYLAVNIYSLSNLLLDANFNQVNLPHNREEGYRFDELGTTGVCMIAKENLTSDGTWNGSYSSIQLYNLKAQSTVNIPATDVSDFESEGDYLLTYTKTGYATLYDSTGKIVRQGQIELNK